MKRFAIVFVAFSLFCLTEPAFSADPLGDAVAKIKAGIAASLKGIDRTLTRAAKEAGQLGPGREADLRKVLEACNAGHPYVIDSAFIDGKGVMRFIEPGAYRKFEGTDISGQEAIVRVRTTRKPTMGKVFVSVEGAKAIDIEYPVLSAGKAFLGSVSMLVKQEEMIRSVAEKVEKAAGVKCWVMQTDGLMLYETDTAQRGLNLFSDPIYKDYPELLALGRRMVKEREGKGTYSFPLHGTQTVVKKEALWKTLHFLKNDWIVVAYREVP